MKKFAGIFALLLLLMPLGGCAPQDSRSSTFYMMDTLITVTLYTRNAEQAEAVFDECRAILTELDSLWARQNAASEIYRLNMSSTGADDLDARTVALLQTALQISEATDGAFDITVAPLVELWNTCGEENRLPTTEEMTVLLASVGSEKLALSKKSLLKNDPNTKIDLGGIGKGAAISALIDHLENTDIQGGLVSFGSNVAVFGKKPNGEDFHIALRDPKDADASVGVLRLTGGEVLSVSGDYERYVTINGARYHHILDPSTGYPSDSGLASVAVVTSDGAVADALSTALFVMGQARAMEFYHSNVYDFEAIFIGSDGMVTVTDGLTNSFSQ